MPGLHRFYQMGSCMRINRAKKVLAEGAETQSKAKLAQI
jgi:hypothetical protein